jgi:hypothetical protein
MTQAAYPLNPYSYTVPLIGEHVIVYQSLSSTASTTNQRNSRYYYGSIIPAQSSIFENSVPGVTSTSFKNNSTRTSQYSAQSGTPNQNKLTTPTLGETFTDTDKPKLPTQPFEGDYLLQGRYGQSIRLGSSFDWPAAPSFYYEQQPNYKGPANSPILILRTPPVTEKQEFYSVENPGDPKNNTADASSIYLTSTQTLTAFETAHGLGKFAGKNGKPNQFNNPQVIITSDRLVFNAKKDSVFIVGKTDVGVITKEWAMMMNKFFNIIRDLLDTLASSSVNERSLAPFNGTGPAVNPALKIAIDLLKKQLNNMSQ